MPKGQRGQLAGCVSGTVVLGGVGVLTRRVVPQIGQHNSLVRFCFNREALGILYRGVRGMYQHNNRGHGLSKNLQRVAWVCLVMIAPVSLSAATYYSAPDGGGGRCSETAPCVLGTAVNKARSGDTIVLKDGTYRTNVITRQDGVSFRAENRHQAIIKKPSGPNRGDRSAFLIKHSNVVVSGLVIDGQNDTNFVVGLS